MELRCPPVRIFWCPGLRHRDLTVTVPAAVQCRSGLQALPNHDPMASEVLFVKYSDGGCEASGETATRHVSRWARSLMSSRIRRVLTGPGAYFKLSSVNDAKLELLQWKYVRSEPLARRESAEPCGWGGGVGICSRRGGT
jgi:hypothetical protein